MTSPSNYSPQSPDIIDTIRYTQDLVEKILRNNPLTDAVVSQGLIRWLGNYTNAGDPSRINFLWIGNFNPADTNLPGNPPQRGFSLVRDDGRGGVSALSLYDSNPSGGGGLRQTLTITSGDGKRLASESRNGGWSWPEENIWMGSLDSDLTTWVGNTSGSFSGIFEGRVPVVGNQIAYRVFCATTGGAAGEFRMRVNGADGDHLGTTHTLLANTNAVFDSTVDVTTLRGQVASIYWEARVTNATGKARSQVISARCFST